MTKSKLFIFLAGFLWMSCSANIALAAACSIRNGPVSDNQAQILINTWNSTWPALDQANAYDFIQACIAAEFANCTIFGDMAQWHQSPAEPTSHVTMRAWTPAAGGRAMTVHLLRNPTGIGYIFDSFNNGADGPVCVNNAQ